MRLDSPVVLIGPAAAGKSTVGELLAARLGVPFVDVDAVADPFYAEVGWSIGRLVTRVREVGRVAVDPPGPRAADEGHRWVVDGHDLLAEWVDDPGMRALARRVVHTDGLDPDATVEAVLAGYGTTGDPATAASG